MGKGNAGKVKSDRVLCKDVVICSPSPLGVGPSA